MAGIGDIILGIRYRQAIRDKYPNSELTLFIDSEGNKNQETVVNYLYPDYFKEIFTIPNKKYKKLIIDSQFGSEEVKGFYVNLPDFWREKIESYDLVFNCHIDSLELLFDERIDWSKYFYTLLKPTNGLIPNYLGNYFCSQLISTSGTEHVTEQWWTDKLITDLDNLALKIGFQHYIICTPDINVKYEAVLKKCHSTHFLNASLEEVCDVIANSKGVLAIDSAWRLLSESWGIPTVTLSKNCQGYGNVPFSHRARWLLWPNKTFGLHHNTGDIINLFEKMIQNQIYRVFPELAFAQNLDQTLIKRNYKVNEEKSIL